MIDEAHQHTIATDLLLGFLKELLAQRPDLKVVIMSATIDTDRFLEFFDGAKVEEVRGREFGVEINYLKEPTTNLVEDMVETILQLHFRQQSGDILVFASGKPQINAIMDGLRLRIHGDRQNKPRFEQAQIGELSILELHAQMTAEEQTKVIDGVPPPHRGGKLSRRVIVATNIAETALTVPGVTMVVDSGKVKIKSWNPETETYSLREQGISQSQAKQRAGRAGRVRPGEVWRMCTQNGFHAQLTEHAIPEMSQGDMIRECLDILKMGRNPINFPYFTPPATETIVKALGMLEALGAVAANNNGLILTQRGQHMSRLPVNIFSAASLLAGPEFGCADEILSLVSMIEATDGGQRLFCKPADDQQKRDQWRIKDAFGREHGDHIMLFNIFVQWRHAEEGGGSEDFLKRKMLLGDVLRDAQRTRLQLLRPLLDMGRESKEIWRPNSMLAGDPRYYVKIKAALAAGHFLRVARREGNDSGSDAPTYRTFRQNCRAILGKDTRLANRTDDWVVYNECSVEGRQATLRLVTPVPLRLLITAAPAYWAVPESAPRGHIRDELVQVLAEMSNMPATDIVSPMPPKP